MADRLNKKLLKIENSLGGTKKVPLGVQDKLGWHLDYIDKLIEEGGGGGDIQLKTINGQDLKGEGNIAITTYQAFPSSWPTDNQHTAKQFCDVVDADETAVIGMGYFGGAKWSDKPAGLSNGDVVVEILEGPNSTKAIHLIMTSSSVYPYRWEYTYWSHGSTSPWRGVQPELPSRTGHAGEFLKVNANADGFEYGGAVTLDTDQKITGSKSLKGEAGALKFLHGNNDNYYWKLFNNYGTFRIQNYDSYEASYSFNKFAFTPMRKSVDLGQPNDSSLSWKNISFNGSLLTPNNLNYGITMPDTTSWTANKIMATIDDCGTKLYKHEIVPSDTTNVSKITLVSVSSTPLTDWYGTSLHDFISAVITYQGTDATILYYSTSYPGGNLSVNLVDNSGSIASVTVGAFTDTVTAL